MLLSLVYSIHFYSKSNAFVRLSRDAQHTRDFDIDQLSAAGILIIRIITDTDTNGSWRLVDRT